MKSIAKNVLEFLTEIPWRVGLDGVGPLHAEEYDCTR
jgi:hypothetical protein